MTRIRKTFITVLATSAATVAVGSSAAAADYSSVGALVGAGQSEAASGYGSLNAIATEDDSGNGVSDYSSPGGVPENGPEPASPMPLRTVPLPAIARRLILESGSLQGVVRRPEEFRAHDLVALERVD